MSYMFVKEYLLLLFRIFFYANARNMKLFICKNTFIR